MQSSQTSHNISQKDNEPNPHRPVKHVRSHDSKEQPLHQHQQQRKFRKNRSFSSGFRHSIRNLTSCALAKRKSNQNSAYNEHDGFIIESITPNEDEHRHLLKSFPISTRSSSSSPSNKKNNRRTTLTTVDDDTAPPIPARQPLKQRISGPKTLNAPVIDTSSPEQSIKSEDITILNSRKLSNKEISTSLVNLMGTATDTVPIHHQTQILANESRHISSTPAASVDRLGLYGSTSNVTLESPLPQRAALSNTSSSSSCTKSTNDYTWCYESSNATINGLSFDECLPRLEIDDKPLIYREQFESTEHFNWYGLSDSHGPVIISYKFSNDQDKQRYIMAIVRTRQRTSIESLLDISSSMTCLDILRRICDQCTITDIEYFDPILCDGTHDLLIKYDEFHLSTKHKFGIIYQRENQLTEEDIFSNETHSPAMNKFLDLIGIRVKLRDFQGFRGGLDVKSDQTGIESIYEQFHNHEIMFHVSTLLPYSKSERQQLERKRHIGNDIVAIVFQEKETIFNPECITSQFLHVYLVVTPLDSRGQRFKVSIIHRDSVPTFGPNRNSSNIFSCDQIFKQWLLTKLINAELASCRANTFQKYQERTKLNLFENLYRTLHENNRLWMNYIFHHSQYKHEQQRDDSSSKIYDRHSDNSLLGSVRRRFIASKIRQQQTAMPSPPAAIIISSTGQTNETKSKIRSMTMDLNRSTTKDSMATNGKMISMFSIAKNPNSRTEKSNQENPDSILNSRSNSKYLLSVTSASTPSTDFNSHEDTFLPASAFDFSKIPSDDVNHENYSQTFIDSFQSSTKDDLIKYIIALQQQHSIKLAQLDENHSKTIKQLELQFLHQQQSVDREN